MPPIPLLREIDTEEQWLEMLNTEVCIKTHLNFLSVTKTFVTRHIVLEILQLATHKLVS